MKKESLVEGFNMYSRTKSVQIYNSGIGLISSSVHKKLQLDKYKTMSIMYNKNKLGLVFYKDDTGARKLEKRNSVRICLMSLIKNNKIKAGRYMFNKASSKGNKLEALFVLNDK